jgi:uncharacterized membrane protein ArfC
MIHVHWWLIGLAFVLGLVLTFALMKRPAALTKAGAAPPAMVSTEKAPVAPAPGNEAPAPVAPAKPVAGPPPVRLWPEKKTPAAAGPPAKKAPPSGRARKLPYEPFGPGSARATSDGGGPAGWPVKGRTDTRLYYTPADPAYDLTVAHVWFKDERSAARALFTPWRKSSRKT